ncbi:hypothetical protein K469DRAFT_635881 [Zopfia rhizophila CBS 207.26]|uniref:DUF7730 domain-containing protein n=1 Tax=Zopfia rhizophila CBS 207.26 TaxID=1314779 RepID=A0A6A6DYA5_9PEZI|nr:hypothetical protein K469DRAFT_635881 [Zopfia rhizophila CBS 207.26]
MASVIRKLRSKLSGSKKSTAPAPEWPPSAAWPLQDTFPQPTMNQQLHSPLFRKLSPEPRILIYQVVLGDPERYLHICMNEPDGRGARSVAHFRRIDMDSPFPTWQHKCFGEERVVVPGKYSAFKEHPRTETDDKLLALLLTCRLIYSEALEILYRDNVFHFRGGLGLPAFRGSIPKLQWTTIRHLHISTAYTPFYRGDPLLIEHHPPDTLPNWNKICEQLKELPSLQSLRFDIMARGREINYPFDKYKTDLLMSILRPLKDIHAHIFEVELNVEIPNEVWKLVRPVNFTTVLKERPFNEEVFRANTLHDATDVPVPAT